jgi:lipoate-protein ligase A
MWSQTPAFSLILDAKDDIGVEIKVHHGVIKSMDFGDSGFSDKTRSALRTAIVGLEMHEIRDWTAFLQKRIRSWDNELVTIASRLDQLLPIPPMSKY